MNSVAFFLILVLGVASFFPLRLKMRERNMARLARDLGRQFTSNFPNLIDFYLKLLWGDWKLNVISGNIGDHHVRIYDSVEKSPSENGAGRDHTVIEVDGKFIKGKEDEYKTLRLGDACLTPVWSIRKILTNLQRSEYIQNVEQLKNNENLRKGNH